MTDRLIQVFRRLACVNMSANGKPSALKLVYSWLDQNQKWAPRKNSKRAKNKTVTRYVRIQLDSTQHDGIKLNQEEKLTIQEPKINIQPSSGEQL